MAGRLAGRTAIVTGGTDGIGLEVCRAFVREGANVVAVARREEPGAVLVAELGAAGAFVPGDVADPTVARRAVAEATGLWILRSENLRLREENERLRRWQSVASRSIPKING